LQRTAGPYKWVNRDRVEPVASPVISAVPPKAEVNFCIQARSAKCCLSEQASRYSLDGNGPSLCIHDFSQNEFREAFEAARSLQAKAGGTPASMAAPQFNRNLQPSAHAWALSDRAALPAGNKSVNEEHDDSPDDSTDQSCAFSSMVPAQRLSKVSCNESANNSKKSGQDEAGRFVITRHDELCYHPSDEANNDCPENAHCTPLLN